MEDLLDTPDVFADFTSLGDTMKNINNAIAVNVFFAWIKLFKYISFNKTMTQLSSTLARVSNSQLCMTLTKNRIYIGGNGNECILLNRFFFQCAGDVMGFGVMFFIVFFAFAQLGYLLFGTQVNIEHSTKIDSPRPRINEAGNLKKILLIFFKVVFTCGKSS